MVADLLEPFQEIHECCKDLLGKRGPFHPLDLVHDEQFKVVRTVLFPELKKIATARGIDFTKAMEYMNTPGYVMKGFNKMNKWHTYRLWRG